MNICIGRIFFRGSIFFFFDNLLICIFFSCQVGFTLIMNGNGPAAEIWSRESLRFPPKKNVWRCINHVLSERTFFNTRREAKVLIIIIRIRTIGREIIPHFFPKIRAGKVITPLNSMLKMNRARSGTRWKSSRNRRSEQKFVTFAILRNPGLSRSHLRNFLSRS